MSGGVDRLAKAVASAHAAGLPAASIPPAEAALSEALSTQEGQVSEQVGRLVKTLDQIERAGKTARLAHAGLTHATRAASASATAASSASARIEPETDATFDAPSRQVEQPTVTNARAEAHPSSKKTSVLATPVTVAAATVRLQPQAPSPLAEPSTSVEATLHQQHAHQPMVGGGGAKAAASKASGKTSTAKSRGGATREGRATKESK